MFATRTIALGYIFENEGPELNDSPEEIASVGGSKYGVSLNALKDLRKLQGLPVPTLADIAALTEATASQFYIDRFMPPIRFDELPSGVDYRLFDAEVNLGPTGGVNLLELVFNVYPLTGKMTDRLLAQAKLVSPVSLIMMLGAAWISKKHESPNWPKYAHGWTNRAAQAQGRAIAMVTP